MSDFLQGMANRSAARAAAARSFTDADFDKPVVPLSLGAFDVLVEGQDALLGGEEFELLVALPGDITPDIGSEFAASFELPLSGIGHVESGSGVRVLKAGVPVKLNGGFSHFDI